MTPQTVAQLLPYDLIQSVETVLVPDTTQKHKSIIETSQKNIQTLRKRIKEQQDKKDRIKQQIRDFDFEISIGGIFPSTRPSLPNTEIAHVPHPLLKRFKKLSPLEQALQKEMGLA